MANVIAYFLTWTTHGTWLHGDGRLSVDRHRNQRGLSLIAPNPMQRSRNRVLVKGGPVMFSDAERRIVHKAIEECAEFRGWKILAMNVRTNHVHVVVQAPSHTPERVMNDFKTRATRILRERGLRPNEGRVWTQHGSTRWVNDEASLAAAIDYVLNQQ